MWDLDRKECREPKNWCFQTVVLEKTFESPLDCKEIKPVNPKGNQPWIFIRTDGVQTVVLEKTFESPLDCKEIKPVNPKGIQPWIFIRRTHAEAWCWHEFVQTLGDSEGQGSLACCSPWGPKELTRLSDWITINKTNSVYMSTPNSHKVIFKNCNSDPYTLCLKSPVISHQARKKSDFFLNSYVMCPDNPVLIFHPIPFFPHLFFTVCLWSLQRRPTQITLSKVPT